MRGKKHKLLPSVLYFFAAFFVFVIKAIKLFEKFTRVNYL